MLRAEEYDMPGASVVVADTLEELAAATGMDPAAFGRTVAEFNSAVDRSVPLDIAKKDGRASRVEPPKSNWAIPFETPPY